MTLATFHSLSSFHLKDQIALICRPCYYLAYLADDHFGMILLSFSCTQVTSCSLHILRDPILHIYYFELVFAAALNTAESPVTYTFLTHAGGSQCGDSVVGPKNTLID